MEASKSGIPPVDEALKVFRELEESQEKKLNEAKGELIDLGVTLVLVQLTAWLIKRGVRKRGGPEWAAWGLSRVGVLATSYGTRMSAKKAREQIEADRALRQKAEALGVEA